MTQRACKCGNPIGAGPSDQCSVCAGEMAPVAQLRPPTADQFAEFAANPFAGPKELIPSEEAEAFARGLREQYVALTRQGFSDKQALTICGHVIAGIIGNVPEDGTE